MKVELLDHMGDDLSVVNAARVSYAKTHEFFAENDADVVTVSGWARALVTVRASTTDFPHIRQYRGGTSTVPSSGWFGCQRNQPPVC